MTREATMARKRAVGGETEHTEPAHDLRERAESELRARAGDGDVPAPDDLPRLLHDLRVHQIELEMQNEELRRAQQELEASRERYFELYDLAPVGYLTISEKGLILEANLAVARIFSVERTALVGKPITRFIVEDDQDTYYLYRKALFESGEAQRCDLRLERADSTPLWAHIDATLASDSESDSPVCRATLTDITELKRYAEALTESEERYALAAAGANDGIWDWDMITGQAYMSPRYKEMLGYAEDELGDSYAMWESLLHPDDRQAAVATMKALQSGEISEFRLEYRLRHKDGSYRWILDRGKAVRDEQGRPHRAAGSHTDITERKQAEEALRTSEARYASFIDATEDMAFIKDDELRYLVVNRVGEAFFGAAAAEIVGRTDEDVMPPDAVAGCRDSDLLALERGDMVIAEEPVGDRIYEVRKFPVALGSARVGVGGYVRDITEARRSRAALEERTQRLAALNELALDLADLPAEVSLQDFLTEKLMGVTGAAAVAFNDYELRDKALVLREVRFAEGLPRKVAAAVRKPLIGLRSPVSDEAYRTITENIVATLPTLTEASFGAVSPAIGAALQRALGVDRLVALVYVIEGRLYGTSVAALRSGVPDPSPDLLESFAHMGAVSLRRWRADEALKDSEERHRVLFEMLPTGVTVADETGRITEANRAAERILGLTPVAQRQRTIDGPEWSVIRPDGSPMPDDEYASVRALKEQRPIDNIELGVVRPGGETVWLSVNAAPLPDHRVAISYDDLTERKLAEEALRESEQRLELAHRATNDVVWDWDIVHDAQRWNAAGATVFGWTEIVEHAVTAAWWVERVHPDDRRRVEEGFFAVVDDPARSSWQEDYRFLKADGDYAQVMDRGYVLRDARGRAVRMIGAMLDITERKQAQDALADSATRLQATLHDTVKAMGEIVGLRDPYTARHEKSVTRLAIAIAEDLGLDEKTREGLMLAGEVHDIGKICVPAEILSKPAALTDMEYRLVQQHAQTGREILSGITFQQPVAEIVGQHHERLDGSGYPDGLAGDDIRSEARILAVADVIEAMASHRPYRPALGMEAALAEVRAGAGKVYDADVAAACERVIAAGFSLEEPDEGR
jgi:PAS domain S-box-containing protein/putative nucleotidyltransferase with HDIG domain